MRNLLLALLLLASPLSAQTTISGVTLEDLTITVAAQSISDCGDVSNLVGWWKADAGITEDVGVTTWADQSGNGNDWTQTTDSYEPTLTASCQNSLDCVEFDGIDDRMTASNFGIDLATEAITIVAVLDYETESSSDYILGEADGTGVGSTWLSLDDVGAPSYAATWIGGAEHSGTTDIGPSNTRLVVVAFAGGATAAVDIYVDGGSDENSDTDTGEAADGAMVLGSSRTEALFSDHKIMEMCVYDAVLSTSDRDDLEAALNTKWVIY